jgi:ABC-type uncharacterized transport system YnjBCD permease subunit
VRVTVTGYGGRVLVIFGTKAYVTVLTVLTLVCRVCGNPAAQRIEKRVTRFTLFFIPTIAISTRYSVQCAMCGATSRIEQDEAERLAAGPPSDLKRGLGQGQQRPS